MSFTINLSNVQDSQPVYSPIKEGKYKFTVTGVEHAPTQAGGEMLKLELTVANGEYTGRKVWHNFNVKNANPKAVEIAYQQLKQCALSAGIKESELVNFNPITSLYNRQVWAQVGTREYNGDTFNNVKYFLVKDQNVKVDATMAKDSIPF